MTRKKDDIRRRLREAAEIVVGNSPDLWSRIEEKTKQPAKLVSQMLSGERFISDDFIANFCRELGVNATYVKHGRGAIVKKARVGRGAGVKRLKSPQQAKKNTGWICPVCRRGVSPKQETCPCVFQGKGEFVATQTRTQAEVSL